MTNSSTDIETILRVAACLTDDQVRRLVAARRDAGGAVRFDRTLHEVRSANPAAETAVDRSLAPVRRASRARFEAWAEVRLTRAFESASPLAMAAGWTMLIGTLLTAGMALAGAVSWLAPVVVFASSLVVLVLAPLTGLLIGASVTVKRDRLLEEALDIVAATILATILAPTWNSPNGVNRADCELLAGPWSREILPLPSLR
jgi:hypothetical protein